MPLTAWRRQPQRGDWPHSSKRTSAGDFKGGGNKLKN
jgi:hypothetical protein